MFTTRDQLRIAGAKYVHISPSASLDQLHRNQFALQVNGGDASLQLVAEAKYLAARLADQTVIFLFKEIEVVGDVAHIHHAFCLGNAVFDIDAPFSHSRNAPVDFLPDALGEVFALLIFDRSTLGI